MMAYDDFNLKLATDVYFKDEDVAPKEYFEYALFTEVKTDGTGVDYNSLVEEGKYARWIGVVDSPQEQLTVAKNVIGNTMLYSALALKEGEVGQYTLTLDTDQTIQKVMDAFPVPQTKVVNYKELVEELIAFNVQGKKITIKVGCVDDTECGAGKKCVSVGEGKPKVCSDGTTGSGCGAKGDCMAGLICIDNKCGGGEGADCTDATKCASGFCVNGKCTSGGDGAPCAKVEDCKSKVCTDGKCVGGGDSDGDGVNDVDDKCLGTPSPLKNGISVFPKGHPFAGCIRGDMNKDGAVDGKDYTPWLDDYRVQMKQVDGLSSVGDMNNDGFIDGKDYTPWLDAYRIYTKG
jgi:hypothetical protein